MTQLNSRLVWILGFVSASALAGCSGDGATPEPEPTGAVQLGLVAHTTEHTYRLRDATFDITKPPATPVATLDSETDPDATELTQRLDPGDYRIALQDSWFLTRIDPGEPETTVDAFLQSPMSGAADFSIEDGVTTSVPYIFNTNGIPIGFGTGELSVGIVINESVPTTQLDLATSPAVTTELGTLNSISLTLSGSGGFSGPVGLAGSLVDALGAPMTGWALSVEPELVTVPLNGVATATATITIPTENKGLAATARFFATSAAGLGQHTASVAVTALNQYTIGVGVQAGQCVYPAAGTTRLTAGTKLRFRNDAAFEFIVIHTSGIPGCAHQDVGSPSQPGGAYECTLSAFGSGEWYCHSPGPNVPGHIIQVVAP